MGGVVRGNRKYWLAWLGLAVALSTFFSMKLFGNNKAVFLPGETSHGHYQIELACDACHTSPFGGGEVLQQACMDCHGTELKQADDSHPKSKFTDPRNAARVAKLDARQCVTCHVEHKPEITHAMGVTVAEDVCFHCHQDVAEDRPSHAGMGFETCASAGCHNFHDNRALYEDFLVKHAHQAEILSDPVQPERALKAALARLNSYPKAQYPFVPLVSEQRDAPAQTREDPKITEDWLTTAHAQAGVNCSACHQAETGWIAKPSRQQCETCHAPEVDTFLAGRHGMRLAQDLPSMTPSMARQPMRSDAHDKSLTCTSCHSAHRFDTRRAAVEACLGCHSDEHSRQYKDSPHYKLWVGEQRGALPEGSGVTCATCHMPRVEHKHAGVQRILVQHNQNDTLRPNEKMLRPVCMDCHGLGFAIDALADTDLIKTNFQGQPSRHIESIDMAIGRVDDKQAEQK